MSALTAYGFISVALMLVFYALENRSHWFVLLFAGACLMSSIYGFLQHAWPFGAVEGIWTFVALRRWMTLEAPATMPELKLDAPLNPATIADVQA